MLQVLAVQAAGRCFLEKSSVKLNSTKVLSFVGFANVLRTKKEVDTAWSVVKSRLNNRSSCYNNYSDDYMDFSSCDTWKS